MFIDWLPDVLRDAGVPIYVEPGAERRSSTRSGLTVIRGIVWHDTVTGKNWTDAQVRNLLRVGNAYTPGPLSQVGVARNGRWDLIAFGKCNHNGYGLWKNDCIGLEFYNAGGDVKEINPPEQVESGLIGSAAILKYLKKDAQSSVKGHKETDPRRKRDPHALNMNNIRERIHVYMHPPTPLPELKDDDMVDDIRQLHEVFLGADPDPRKWNKSMLQSFNYHLHLYAKGRPLDDIRGDFARTVGV